MKITRDMKRVARLLLCLSLPAACTVEEAVLPEPSDGKEVRLELSARVHAAGAPESRALGDNENFPAGDYRFGTWICYSDSLPKFVPSKIGYANLQTDMKATANGQTWKYTFENGRDGTLNVSRGVPVHIYTFYPRPQNGPHTTRLDSVPFTSGPTDWMWAVDSIAGEKLAGGNVEVPLKFGHAMTCLSIIIKCKYAGSTLTSITLKDKQERIYTGGTMNLAEQNLTLDEADRTGELKVTYDNAALSTTEKDFYIFIPAVEGYEDGDFTLSFVFDKNPAKTEFSIPKKIKGPDGTDVYIESFETGKRYTYRLTLDNPATFVPAGVDESWTTENRDMIL